LEGNPDKDEIMADIEHSIADKCRAVLGVYKTVVETREVGQIIEEMGPVEDASAAEESQPGAGAARAEDTVSGAARTTAAGSGAPPPPPPPPARRLYKIREGAMFAGVCAGLAAYFGIDVTIVRVIFALLTVLTWGLGVLAYFFLMLVLPSADTAAEKAAAYGAPSTAQEFIRRAKEGYYEGMKTWGDRRRVRSGAAGGRSGLGRIHRFARGLPHGGLAAESHAPRLLLGAQALLRRAIDFAGRYHCLAGIRGPLDLARRSVRAARA
jgi:phage shock protein PspC (stress-responsive transcriptional regulator)